MKVSVSILALMSVWISFSQPTWGMEMDGDDPRGSQFSKRKDEDRPNPPQKRQKQNPYSDENKSESLSSNRKEGKEEENIPADQEYTCGLPNEIWLNIFSHVLSQALSTSYDEVVNTRNNLRRVNHHFNILMDDQNWVLLASKEGLASIKGFSLEQPFDESRPLTLEYARALFSTISTTSALKSQGKLSEVARVYINALKGHLSKSRLISYRLARLVDKGITKDEEAFKVSKTNDVMKFLYLHRKFKEDINKIKEVSDYKTRAFLKLFLRKDSNDKTLWGPYSDAATGLGLIKNSLFNNLKNENVYSSEFLLLIALEDWMCLRAPQLKVNILTMAANKGNAKAQYLLGGCYEQGIMYPTPAQQCGVPRNLEEAAKWYTQAAEQGHSGAQYNLGLCYANGEGVEQSWEEAVEWFQKSAKQGNSGAQYNLGLCYANGEGVEQSRTEAVKWYRQAAETGNPFALACLMELGFKGET